MKTRLFFSFLFFVKIALATILPLVVFVLPAVLLDRRLLTSPSLTVIAVIISIIVTSLSIVKASQDAIKKIQKLD